MALYDSFRDRIRAAGRAFLAPSPTKPARPRRADLNNDEGRGAYTEPHVRTITTWTPDDIRRAIQIADNGDLIRAADLCEAILGDDRVSGVLNTRINALLGAPLTFEPGRGRRRGAAVRALEGSEDWWTMLPETMIRQHLRWAWLLGLSYGQLQYADYADHGGRTLPVLDFWHPQHLRQDTIGDRRWYVTVGSFGGTEIPVEPNAGKWVFLFPFGPDRPWAHGLWRGLSRLWLSKSLAYDDWSRYGDAHGNPLRVGLPPETGNQANNGTPGLRKQLASDLAEMAGGASIVLPPGFDFKLIEATANTWETFKAQIEMANAAISIAVLGSNLPTEVSGGAGTGATAQHLVRVDYKRSDASTVAEWAHDGLLVHWAYLNWGDRGLAPWPTYDVEPEADKKAKIDVAKTFAEAVAAQAQPGARDVAAIDFEALGEDLDIPLLAKEEPRQVPPAPPVPPAPAPAAEEQQSLVALNAAAAADAAAWIATAALATTPDARQERIDEAFRRYHDTVNMGAAELERWAATECSRLASLDRAPIERNLRLLRKDKADWTIEDASDAMRTVSFVSRMRGAEQGEPARRGCPSRRDISLKNWAFDPGKVTASVVLNGTASMGAIALLAVGRARASRAALVALSYTGDTRPAADAPAEIRATVEAAPLTWRYENPDAVGGWLGAIEPPDESWIAFVAVDGKVLLWTERELTGGVIGKAFLLWRPDLARRRTDVLDELPAQVRGICGIPVHVTRPRGFVQRKLDDAGQLLWERTYSVDYGEIAGTAGGDGDALDVFIGPDESAEFAWWVVQVREDGAFDEYKVILGARDEDAARAIYLAHVPKQFLGSISPMPLPRLQAMCGVAPERRATMNVVTLAGGRGEIAPAVEGQLYIDRVARKMNRGPEMVRKALAAVEGAESYEEAQKALLALADNPEDPAFMDMVAGAMTLAAAAGIWTVDQEVGEDT